MNRCILTAYLLLALLWIPVANAVEQRISLHGFATLGAARTSEAHAEPVRDLSQPRGITRHWDLKTDSLIGLQAGVTLTDILRASVQIVARYRNTARFDPELTWGHLAISPNSHFILRLGRLGSEFYMGADSRFVGYSYLTVRPPPDYYATLPFNYFDGADLSLAMPLSHGLLRTKIYGGLSQEKIPWGRLQSDLTGSLIVGGYIDYVQGNWQWRVGHAAVHFSGDLPIPKFYSVLPKKLAHELSIDDKWAHFSSVGLIYNSSNIDIQFMVSKTRQQAPVFQDTWSGYLIASRCFGEFEPFLGISAVKSSRRNPEMRIPSITDPFQAVFTNNHKTLFFGLRWDLLKNISIKTQVDMIRGSSDSVFLFRNENPNWDGSSNILSLTLDMVF